MNRRTKQIGRSLMIAWMLPACLVGFLVGLWKEGYKIGHSHVARCFDEFSYLDKK